MAHFAKEQLQRKKITPKPSTKKQQRANPAQNDDTKETGKSKCNQDTRETGETRCCEELKRCCSLNPFNCVAEIGAKTTGTYAKGAHTESHQESCRIGNEIEVKPYILPHVFVNTTYSPFVFSFCLLQYFSVYSLSMRLLIHYVSIAFCFCLLVFFFSFLSFAFVVCASIFFFFPFCFSFLFFNYVFFFLVCLCLFLVWVSTCLFSSFPTFFSFLF